MKIVRWMAVFLVFLLLVSSLWAQEPEDLLRSFTRNFAIASLDVKMQIIQDAGHSATEPGIVDALVTATRQFANRFSALSR